MSLLRVMRPRSVFPALSVAVVGRSPSVTAAVVARAAAQPRVVAVQARSRQARVNKGIAPPPVGPKRSVAAVEAGPRGRIVLPRRQRLLAQARAEARRSAVADDGRVVVLAVILAVLPAVLPVVEQRVEFE
jgi:hypothetical protein